jgi:hypothetical protein
LLEQRLVRAGKFIPRRTFLRGEVVKIFLGERLFPLAFLLHPAWFIVLATFDTTFGFDLALLHVGIARFSR